MSDRREERLIERRVTYTLEMAGELYIVENVPARVDEETGEQFFAPSTIERLHETILGRTAPTKFMEIPVYEYSE